MERGFLSSGGKGGKQKKNASNNVASDDAKDFVNEELDTSLSMLNNLVVNVDGLGNSRWLSGIATKLGKPLILDSYLAAMCIDSWGKASYARAMIELKADVKFRDTIVVAVLKFSGGGFITSTIYVEYEWAPARCSECKIFGHILDDCLKKIISDMPKNSKMPRQPSRGPLVQMANKATTPILNSFDALSTLVDEEEGEGNQTPITNATLMVAKINDLERQMLDGKLVHVDNHGKPVEIKLPDDETSRYMASTGGGGFLEDDLDFYDGYEAQVYDLPEQMQTFVINLISFFVVVLGSNFLRYV
ncbi:hypothetical protein Tco_0149546 [Tanacetum coccineum]